MSGKGAKTKLPFKPRISGPERRARIEGEAARLFAEREPEVCSSPFLKLLLIAFGADALHQRHAVVGFQ